MLTPTRCHCGISRRFRHPLYWNGRQFLPRRYKPIRPFIHFCERGGMNSQALGCRDTDREQHCRRQRSFIRCSLGVLAFMATHQLKALDGHSVDHVAFSPTIPCLITQTLWQVHAIDVYMVSADGGRSSHADRHNVHKLRPAIDLVVKDDDRSLLDHLPVQVLGRELTHEDLAGFRVVGKSHVDQLFRYAVTLHKQSRSAMQRSVDNSRPLL